MGRRLGYWLGLVWAYVTFWRIPKPPQPRLSLRVVNEDDAVICGPLSPETLALLIRYGGFAKRPPALGALSEGWVDLRAVLGFTPYATLPGRLGDAVGDLRLQLRVDEEPAR